MGNMIKAVFFDIDGTLVSFKTHEVPPSTIKALALLREKGIKVFIATGRHRVSINNLGDLKFDGYVTLNGGYCFVGEDKVVYKHHIPSADIDALIRYMHANPFPCAFVQEKQIYMNYIDATVQEMFDLLNFPAPPIAPLSDIKGEVYQLIAFFPVGDEQKVMAVLPHCEATRWNPLFADVVPGGGSKSVGIDHVLEYFNIKIEESMAFGDGGNDVAMLRHVGIGVAMGNSADDVKLSARYVTDSVDDDGIYNALKHFGVV